MHLPNLPLDELRDCWAKAWGKQPHGTMGRKMMIESIKFKHWEQETGGLAPEQQKRLNDLMTTYKRNPNSVDKTIDLKPGTRLVRRWKGETYSVTVKQDGFEYEGKAYRSLSKIANEITGSRWNGWVFFGLKKSGAA